MDYRDEFNIITKAQSERLRQQDLEDLNHELAGVDVGRIRRFLSPDAFDAINGQRKAKSRLDDLIHQTMLDMMLMDQEYRLLYDDAMNRLRELEEATQQVLDKALSDLAKSRDHLQDTMDRAAILDGQRVFQDAKGHVWTEHDQRVKQTDAERIEWKGSEPSREDYLADREQVDISQQRVDGIREYQTDALGNARERLTDKDNPLTKDELRTLIEDFDTQLAATKQQPDMVTKAPDPDAVNSDFAAEIPKL